MSDDRYRLSKDDILARGPKLLNSIAESDSDSSFWRDSWAFIFELRIDLETAMVNEDKERELLYLNGIKATSNMVKSILEIYQLSQIVSDRPNGSS